MSDINEVKQVFSSEPFDKNKGPSIEHMTTLKTFDTVRALEEKIISELMPANARNELISFYNQILKQINTVSEEDGSLSAVKFDEIISDAKANFENEMAKAEQQIKLKADTTPEAINKDLQNLKEKYQPFFDLLENTKKMGDEITKGAKTFTSMQKTRLEENLKYDLDDLKIKSSRDQENIGRLYQKSLEAHQNARLLIRTLHDMKMGLIKNWAPR